MAAWQDARFGLFLHWGVYSVYGGTHRGKELWSAEWIQENERIPWSVTPMGIEPAQPFTVITLETDGPPETAD